MNMTNLHAKSVAKKLKVGDLVEYNNSGYYSHVKPQWAMIAKLCNGMSFYVFEQGTNKTIKIPIDALISKIIL